MGAKQPQKKKTHTNCIKFSRFYAAPCRVRLVHAKNKRRTTEPTGSLGSSLQPSISFLPIQSMVRSQSSNLVVPSMNIARNEPRSGKRRQDLRPQNLRNVVRSFLSLCLSVSLSLSLSLSLSSLPPSVPRLAHSLSLSLSLSRSLSPSLSLSLCLFPFLKDQKTVRVRVRARVCMCVCVRARGRGCLIVCCRGCSLVHVCLLRYMSLNSVSAYLSAYASASSVYLSTKYR